MININALSRVLQILLVFSLALIIYSSWVFKDSFSTNIIKNDKVIDRTKHQLASMVKIIESSHLFGQSSMTRTQLDLPLKGIFSSTNVKKLSVIVDDEYGAEKRYVNGDTLPGGYKIQEIKRDQLLVTKNAKDFFVSMEFGISQ